MITTGTACARPVSEALVTPSQFAMSGWKRAISLWITPITSAAPTVMPKDENRPTSAAARAGMTASDSTAALSVTIGARRIAARADSAPAVIGHGGGGQAEQRPGVDELQHERADERDRDQEQAVEPDVQVAPQRHD